MTIYEYLKNFSEISFHTPGHKGRIPFEIKDITEIEGSDNFSCPTGIIKNSQKLMAEALGKEDSFFLVNGASSGIIASILAYTSENDTVLIDRNCHSSVIDGLILSGAVPKYIYPEYNADFGIPLPIKTLNYTNEKMVIITTPTYYGDTADIENIKSQCKSGILLCDEAHGAHFYFSKRLKTPDNADISVISFHKTMPTLNQGAVLCLNGLDPNLIKQTINIMSTTSPSYPIMASLDFSRIHGEKIYNKPVIENEIENIRRELNVYNNDDFYKILTNCEKTYYVNQILREKYNINSEGIFGNNILFMLSPYNTAEEIKTLKTALSELKPSKKSDSFILPRLETVLSPRQTFQTTGEMIETKNATGRISKENITEFPPCVPVVVMGEKITKEILPFIKREYINVVK